MSFGDRILVNKRGWFFPLPQLDRQLDLTELTPDLNRATFAGSNLSGANMTVVNFTGCQGTPIGTP